MRIAINTRFLLKGQLEGLGLYTHEVSRRLVDQHPHHEYHFFFDRPYDEEFIYGTNVIPHVVFPPARHPALWYTWFEWSVPRRLKKLQPDIFFSPDGFTSLTFRGKKATVIHDLGFEHYPEHLPPLTRRYYRRYTPKYCRSSDHIFAVSETTRSDICSTYDIPPSRVSVAFNGCREGFLPIDDKEKHAIRKIYSEGKPYFLFVGALHPRKNTAHLLRSFEEFCKREEGFKLLVTGRKAWMNREMEEVFHNMEYNEDVHFLGYLDKEDLQNVTGAAFACLYPSVFEGFGVPMLEAMNCGVPVVASNVSVMPEIVGDAGLLIDPFSVESTVQGMLKVVKDDARRSEMIEKGFQRAEEFSWDTTADVIWKRIKEMVNG
ncbi:MAG: glycosyltransferase family 1 protein [Saprospiraceae bacterium]|nr:glycosyltransferase family 1 protein [Saprospiraceae bacterium]